MKRLTAILASALVLLTASLPAAAEPDESSGTPDSEISVTERSENAESSGDTASSDESSITESTDEPSTDESSTTESTDEPSTDESSTAESTDESSADESSTAENTSEPSDNESGASQDSREESAPQADISERLKALKMQEYRIAPAHMSISVPDELYVITRETEKDDPVYAANRTTKEETDKSFEKNDIYLKAAPKDFTFTMNVTVSENSDTNAIGDLTDLTEEMLIQISDKLLQSDIYSGCTKKLRDDVMYLIFSIEYESDGTNVSGTQYYTIRDGKCIMMTYQSSGGGDEEYNEAVFGKIIDSVKFDAPKPEVSTEVSRRMKISDIDVRYIYITAASVTGVIALMIMVIAGISYKKTKKLAAAKKAEDEVKKASEAKKESKNLQDTQTDIFSDTEQKNKKKHERRREEKSVNGTDKRTVGVGNDADNTPDAEQESAYLEDTLKFRLPDSAKTADDSELLKALEEARRPYTASELPVRREDEGVVFADHGEKRTSGIEQIGKSDAPEDITFAEISETNATGISDAEISETNATGISDYERRFGKGRVSAEVSPAAVRSDSSYEKRFGGAKSQDADSGAYAAESAFFSMMVDRLRNTNAEVSRDISKMEEGGGSALLNDKTDTDEEERGNSEMGNNRSDKNTIELEISRSEDGSLVIGATNETDGEPMDIEIRDASNFKEDRDREMTERGLNSANENEIYNARKDEADENPFVVKAQSGKKKRKRSRASSAAANAANAAAAGIAAAVTTAAAGASEAAADGADIAYDGQGSATDSGSASPFTDTAAYEPIDTAVTDFEQESGITVERAPVLQRQLIPMQSVFTRIPRLESVNADEYNREYEEMKKSMPRNHVYAQRFSSSDVPQPFVENPKPITAGSREADTEADDNGAAGYDAPEDINEAPADEAHDSESAQTGSQDETFEYYTGYEQNDDPFANTSSDEEVLIKDHKKKKSGSMGKRFRKSLGKLFSGDSSDDGE